MTLPVPALDSLPDLPWGEKLAYLVYMFHKLPQVECPLTHSFEDGQYIRSIAIPKGTLFIGRKHKIGHVVELSTGSVIHVREKCRRLVHAPFVMTTSPGDQVCAWALTDITARTVHPNEAERDIEKLEEHWFGSVDELKSLGESVETTLRKRIYERNSSWDRDICGSWSSRYRYCWF